MNKLSLALAVYNEEANLPTCLESVKDIADEIVVVDGGSTDKTVKIAKSFGAKVINTDNPPIFHINKQKAIDACTGEWILQLDADEVITEELRREIMDIIGSKTDSSGFWIPRKNFFLGKYLTKGGQYPDYTLRLYQNGKGYFPCKSVHEQAKVKGKVGYIKNDLLHNADPTFSRYLMRFNQYTSLMVQEFKDEGVKLGFISFVKHFLVKPLWWFLKTFFRHKGFVDGFPGFVFALFSSLRFPIAYIKYWEQARQAR